MPQLTDLSTLSAASEFLQDYYAGETYSNRAKAETLRLMKKWGWFLQECKLKDGRTLPPIESKLWPMMAHILENQVLANPVPKSLYEATVRTGLSLPIKYTLPIIRNVFPTLIMNKICSVQPMPASSAGTMQLFWLNVYREDAANVNVTTPDSDYAQSEENAVPKRLKMEITSATEEAVKHILNATWSSEAAEDAMGALGINVDREMVLEMSQEIMRELEQVVLLAMFGGATAGNVTWSWTKPAAYTSHTDYYQTLYHAIVDAERLVRGARHQWCNYVVCGLDVIGYVLKSNWFEAGDRSSDPAGPISSGVVLEGRSGRWDIYSSPYVADRQALVSYYPRTMLHTGYIWAPYIPLTPMPLQYSEMLPYDHATLPGAYVNTDKWNRNVRTRNARRMVQPNMFATITISA